MSIVTTLYAHKFKILLVMVLLAVSFAVAVKSAKTRSNAVLQQSQMMQQKQQGLNPSQPIKAFVPKGLKNTRGQGAQTVEKFSLSPIFALNDQLEAQQNQKMMLKSQAVKRLNQEAQEQILKKEKMKELEANQQEAEALAMQLKALLAQAEGESWEQYAPNLSENFGQ